MPVGATSKIVWKRAFAARRVAFVERGQQFGREHGLGFAAERCGGAQPIAAIGGDRSRPGFLAQRGGERVERSSRPDPLPDGPAPSVEPVPEPRYSGRDEQRPPGLAQRPAVGAQRMVVQMVQNHRALRMVARPAGQRIDLDLQLFDQPLLVRGDDVHAADC
jgi:hypothetical protein